MKLIRLSDNKIVLQFDFDPQVVISVRKIDGRIWNAAKKRWEIPMENVKEVLDILTPIGFEAAPEIHHLLKKQNQFLEEIDQIKKNPDIKYEGSLPLHDFQKIGYSFLKSMPHALLGDVPGLGKTIQMIAATEHDPHILIFTMNSLKYNIAAEVKKWIPEAKVLVIAGDKQARAEQWLSYAKTNKYVVANYELLIHDFEHIKKFKWSTVVCDESTRISNPESKTSQNLTKLGSVKRIAMTGTPISNSPIDIFGIFNFLVPGYLGTFYQFKEKYCITDDRFNNVIGYKNMEELSTKVNRFMLRRKKQEVFKELPATLHQDVIFPLSPSERKLYDSVKQQLIKEIKELSLLDTKNLNIIPVKMLRLKQCTNHPALVNALEVTETSKLDALKALLEPIIASGEKAIIFTQFAECLHILNRELEKHKTFCIYGEVKPIKRMIITKEFNDFDGPAIMMMTEAGAYGLNLGSASYIINYDSPWSIEKLTQREGRADRSADVKSRKVKPLTVYNLIAKNSIDEYVIKVLDRKNKVSVDILKDVERMADSGLSMADIEEILNL